MFFFTLLHSCQEFEHPLILIITFIIKFSVLGCAYTLEKSPEAFTDVHDDGVRGLVLLVAKDLIDIDDDGKDAFTVDDGDANDSLEEAAVILSPPQSAVFKMAFTHVPPFLTLMKCSL